MFPTSRDRYYLNTETYIRMIHELKDIPTRAPSRKDSVIDRPSRTEILRWQTLFGFSSADAEAEIIENRAISNTHNGRVETVARWSWERCRALGFDLESYGYWLRMTEQHRLIHPVDTAKAVRHAANSWEIFLFMPVDDHIDRFQWTPEIQRSGHPIVHIVHDHEGSEQKAMVLRI